MELLHFVCFFFQDVSFTDDQCFYFMFPIRGGVFNSVNKKIRKHETEPSVSAERICIRPCITGTCGHQWRQDEGYSNENNLGTVTIVPLEVLC
jgi:hypothetical protein